MANGDISMNYNLLSQKERESMAHQYLYELEVNIYRQELLTIAEPSNVAAAGKLTALKASYDTQKAALDIKFPAAVLEGTIE